MSSLEIVIEESGRSSGAINTPSTLSLARFGFEEDDDPEHLELFALVNELIDMPKDSSKEEILVTMSNLVNKAALHFRNEEMKMSQTKFPYFRTHKREHDYFLKWISFTLEKLKYFGTCIKILDFKEEDSSNNHFSEECVKSHYEIVRKLIPPVISWLRHHIKNSDAEYHNFVRVSSKTILGCPIQ